MHSHPAPAATPSLQRYGLILLLLALLLLGLSLAYREHMLGQARLQAEAELVASSVIATQEIRHWIEDQRLLGSYPQDSGLASELQRLEKDPANSAAMLRRLAWLADRSDRYVGAWLLNATGQLLLGYSPNEMSAPALAPALLDQALATRQPVLIDLHLNAAGQPRMGSLNPLLVGHGDRERVVGFILMGLDPQRHLYPLLQLAHEGEEHMTTLLARREQGGVRYLNPLPGQPQALHLAKPEAGSRLLALQLPAQEREVLTGVDYLGVPALGVVQQIPEMGWTLVTKMDLEAIEAPARREFIILALVLLVVGVVLGLLLWLSQRYLNTQHNLQQMALDLQRERREKIFDFLVHYAYDIVLLMDEQGTILEANEAAARAYGYSRDELLGTNVGRLRAPHTIKEMEAQLQAANGDQGYTFRTEHLRRDGSFFPVEVSSGTFEHQGVRYRQSIIRDISQREATIQALAESEARFRSLIELMVVGLGEMTPERCWLEINPALCAMLGYERDTLLHTEWAQLMHPDDQPTEAALAAELLAGRREEYVCIVRFITAQGLEVWGHMAVRLMQDYQRRSRTMIIMVQDITALKQHELQLQQALEQQIALNRKLEETQNQLLQSEKMASIGQLAAGVAHEINNPVGFVSSNLGTLKGYLDDLMSIVEHSLIRLGPDPDMQALLQDKDFEFLREDAPALVRESLEGIARVKKIVQDLKDFSRVGEVNWQWADLHQGLESTLNIVWNEIKYKARVDKQYGELPLIYCLPSQLNQVFMNLLVNAAHSIEKHGLVTLRTGSKAERVWVEVEDTGCGIAPENLKKIFDPFFTTKPVGKGTGLGLSLSFSIVRKHGGWLEVDSEVGRGSRFRVYLPIIPPEAQASAEQASIPPVADSVVSDRPAQQTNPVTPAASTDAAASLETSP